MRVIFILILIGCTSVAFGYFPRHDHSARRRLVWLGLLALPLAVAIGFGPFVIDHHALSPDERRWMVGLQKAVLAGYVVIPAAMLPFMRGGRVFVVAIGVAAGLLGLAVAAVSVMIIDPGS